MVGRGHGQIHDAVDLDVGVGGASHGAQQGTSEGGLIEFHSGVVGKGKGREKLSLGTQSGLGQKSVASSLKQLIKPIKPRTVGFKRGSPCSIDHTEFSCKARPLTDLGLSRYRHAENFA